MDTIVRRKINGSAVKAAGRLRRFYQASARFPIFREPVRRQTVDMQSLFGQIVEILWWALLGAVAGALVIRTARDLLAARRRARESASSLAPLMRRYEEEQLARMEAEGIPLWRPDPAKLKRISERQS